MEINMIFTYFQTNLLYPPKPTYSCSFSTLEHPLTSLSYQSYLWINFLPILLIESNSSFQMNLIFNVSLYFLLFPLCFAKLLVPQLLFLEL